MKKIRGLKIGVIGAGAMGKHHARICASLAKAGLFGIADIDLARGQELAREYNAEFFADHKEILPLIDAVIIASPTSTHFQVARDCINAGKDLLVEKPIAKTSQEAQELIDISGKNGLVFAVGMIERFNPAFEELRKLIRKERIIGLHLQRFSPFPERITDANVIQDMMIHDLDLVANLLPMDEIEGLKAEGARVKTKQLDRVSSTIYFKSGVIAKVEADRVFGIKSRKIIATTDRGLIEADLLNKQVYVRDLQHHIPSAHHTKKTDQLTAELTDFVKAIKTKGQPRVSAQDGLKALRLAEEVEQACS